ncbi:class D sortase [Cohnella nanjingensis]|uniref:Class D sortase n=1 Tax=Cohnella nanjingensis TaxID=1387779 RepID=A0A7X0RQQ4_9BACL|nr:class D sortase [Cohnella nanjingensis]MBB6670519.1 class D sortase [Cohnella nanjingensis]
MLKRVLPYVCILVGIFIFCYPTIADRYESYRQQALLKEWEQNLKQIEEVPSESESPLAAPSLAPPVQDIAAERDPSAPELQQLAAAKGIDEESVEGILLIDKIDLKLPIITDATQAHLKLSVASILHTGKLGAVGNYAIAGHRNRTYGKNFNRLDEVKVGDAIQVETKNATYTYIVDAKEYVLPTQVEVLESNGKDREITLITCHPMKNPTHRLVVKGKIVDNSK